MMTKLKHLFYKMEARLPMEISLSIKHDGCLIIFTGRLSGIVHFKLLKEHEDLPEVVRERTGSEIEFELFPPLKYADPIDELSARRIRLQIDRAMMEIEQDREIAQMKRRAIETKSDQEATLKVA